MKYFAKINYLGTNFHGFQVQPNERTVQGELCRALDLVFGSKTMVTGCSRTDAGVHASEFCLTIENADATVPSEKLPIAVSRFLPTDISLYYACECDKDFHARYNVKSKEYVYKIRNTKISDPFDYGRVWFLPREIDEIKLERMRRAVSYILGKQDFSAFMSEGSDVEDTVRTVYYVNIEKTGDMLEIKICADGFLYNMVRIIVGTLVEVAYGRFEPEDIKLILQSKDRQNAGRTAPAEGLYLNKVNY